MNQTECYWYMPLKRGILCFHPDKRESPCNVENCPKTFKPDFVSVVRDPAQVSI